MLCDINTEGIGEILSSCKDINAVFFGMTQDMVAVSDRDKPLPVTLEDLAQLTGAELKVSPDAEPASIISTLVRFACLQTAEIRSVIYSL